MAEDHALRCNILRCRALLSAQAVVTTCSHAFCVPCGTRAFEQALVCPACDTSLTQRSASDDIVVAELMPTEDYKSSVIAGLRPEIVIEIAGRALSFWSYQVTQEAAYQALVLKDLDEQCARLERQLQSLAREANQEIAALQERLAASTKSHEMERRRHHELAEQFSEKSRQFQRLQALYDKLKRKALVSQSTASGGLHLSQPDSSQTTPAEPLASAVDGTIPFGRKQAFIIRLADPDAWAQHLS
ncbi:hypothetical protein HK105_209295 [Polyrhizophydium stewartii]|uniref:RING-type domain-containing protein n=1 Tax=Polyrhizophydium stewartii TaxID=2732419 RepID=A0ABR4MVL0_9FUNG